MPTNDDKTPTATQPTVPNVAEAKAAEAAKAIETAISSAPKKPKGVSLEEAARVLLQVYPKGVVVGSDGKLLEVTGTVQAKFALDEVKKGYLPENLDLFITKND